ncbi:LysR family transcriptional regulator [Acuticoccus sediminis]|uniref:LysR family transcriptional regulator n=1 Tax=Acuticoccus sediminis TaxID=2184697 RepID=A0A8B2NZP7_9HYPH|nr:LysR substrate-binding domain-containing protein [Acuticoccus sediminis]RAI02040.1 LysR family transcriptional regulator [Acuticoccus sediminis]
MQDLARDEASGARSSVTLRELEVLRALVEAGKTTVAAQRLGLSQPAVSRALASLENQLGRRLFARTGGRLTPTQDALAIADELGPVFAALARIENRAADVPSHEGTLRIAAPPTIAHRFLPSRIALFVRDNPGLDVTFDVIASDALVSSIAEGRHDLGLTDTVPTHEGVRADLLIATEAICVLPAGHPLAARQVIRPEDLEGQPFVALTRRHSGRAAMDRVFERAGVRRRFVIETATTVSAVEFVREGLGVALVNPFPIVHQLGRGIEARRFAPSIPYRASFLTPRSGPPTPAARGFIDMIHATLARTTDPLLAPPSAES